MLYRDRPRNDRVCLPGREVHGDSDLLVRLEDDTDEVGDNSSRPRRGRRVMPE